ncbi:MAG: TonB-dependent receptor [Alphaproteobacteria bacterium]|nr:TonB-dependent receptor [Alphaproteobacteria bacterium]
MRTSERGALKIVTRTALLGAVAGSILALDMAPAYAATDEIIVNARRREESLKDVPISAFAANEEFLEAFSIDDARGLLAQIPGVRLGSGTVGAVVADDIVVRGVGVARIESSGSPTGIFRDGMFIGNGTYFGRTFTNFDMFDLETFELYKGPQVALWGRQAAGGAVSITTSKPKFDEFSAKATVGYEVEQQAKKFEGVINVPLSSNFAVRFATQIDHRDGGFIKVKDSASPIDGENLDKVFNAGVRGMVRWQPTEWFDQQLTVEFYRSNNPSYSAYFNRPGRGDPGKFGRACTRPLPPSQFLANQYCFYNVDDPQTETDTTNVFYKGVFDLGFGALDISGIYTKRETEVLDEWDVWVHSLTGAVIGFDDGTGATMVAGTILGTMIGTLGVAPGDDSTYPREGFFEKYGIQALFSSEKMGPLSWIAGADYYWTDDRFAQQNYINFYNPYSATVAGIPSGGLIARRYLNQQQRRDGGNSWSVFGSVDYDVLRWLEVSAGARYTQNNTPTWADNYGDYTCPPSGPLPVGCPGPGGLVPGAPFGHDILSGFEVRESVFTPEVSVTAQLSDEDSVYFRYAQGYRPAGFDTRSQGGTFLGAYGTERDESYEVGFKGFAFERLIAIELAAYYNILNNFQIQDRFLGNDGFLRNRISTAPLAIGYGAEANFRSKFEWGPGTVNAGLGFAWSDGYIDAYYAGSTLSVNSDKRLADTRDYQLILNFGYVAPIPNWSDANWFTNVSFRAEGGGWMEAANVFELPQSEMLDATLGFTVGTWRVSAFGHNLTNQVVEKQVLNGVFPEGRLFFWNDPRTWGLEVTKRW